MTRSRWIPLVLAMAGFLACSCTRKTPVVEPGLLQIQLSGEPVSLDPSLVEDGLGFRLLVNLMDGMMGYTNEGELVNRLAEKHSVSTDRKTYRFTLRPGVKWSDGEPVTLEQFMFAFHRALDPQTGSKLSGLLWTIHGARDYVKGKAKRIEGVKIEGDELVIALDQPMPAFLAVMTLPMTYPLRADVLARNAGRWDPLRGKNVPTVGPYRVALYQREQQIRLEATERADPQGPRAVSMRVVADESTGANLFEQGKLDVLTRVPSFDLERYQKQGIIRVTPYLATYFLSFNFRKPPFNDRELRRAVAGAIRKNEILKVLSSGERVASSWVPLGVEGFYHHSANADGVEEVFQDSVRKARARPQPAGLTIGFDTSGRNSVIMEKVQADVARALGWKTELRNTDWKSFVKLVYSEPDAIYRYGWSTPIGDPLIFLSAFVTNDPFSFSKYSNPEYDRLVDRVRTMQPGPAREKLVVEAQKLLVEKEAIIIPLYHYVSTQALGPRIEKYWMSPYGYTRFDETRLKAVR